MLIRAPWFVALLLPCFVIAVSLSALAERPGVIGSFIESQCVDCHSGASAEAGLDLNSPQFDPLDKHLSAWVLVHARVQSGEMPPADYAMPDATERKQFLEVLAGKLECMQRKEQWTYGRADVRRLNRYEYENSLRSLLDAPWLMVADDLPADGIWHLFSKSGYDFTDAMITACSAVLASPGFLYLDMESGELESAALATRLSYFLWNAPPDAELKSRTDLLAPVGLRAETSRLLSDHRCDVFIEHFLDHWLEVRNIQNIVPDAEPFPEYYLDSHLTESTLLETWLFFKALVQENLPVRNLVDSDFTFVYERLARHYGIAFESQSREMDVSFLTVAPGAGVGGFKNSISLDQYIALRMGSQTRFRSLTLGVNADPGRHSLSWTPSGVLIPCEDNAAVLSVANISEFPDDEFERMLSVNVRAVYYTIREASLHLRDGGRVINIGSVNSDSMPFAGGSVYALTKGAVASFTRGLARDLGPRAITVNNIQPGPINTKQSSAGN